MDTNSFQSFPLHSDLQKVLEEISFTTPTPIQAETIPVILEGKDILALAQTGSGKTAAYALPVLSSLQNTKNVEILVLTPTRELARQVATEFSRFSQAMNIEVVQVVGGQSGLRQIELINRKAKVVVATPGRLIDLMESGKMKRLHPHTVILDEADEILDIGFRDSLRQILKNLPKREQTLMFSATMSQGVNRLVEEFLDQPVTIKLTEDGEQHADITEELYVLDERHRLDGLLRLIESQKPEKSLIFCRTKKSVDDIFDQLMRKNKNVKALHGDMSQDARFAAIKALKEGRVPLLVATDVASRGLDIQGLTHVYNFHLPDNMDRYTHRIGRTGRAGEQGVAVTIATKGDLKSHDFFRAKKINEFEIKTPPSLSEMVAHQSNSLVTQLSEMDVSDDVKAFCKENLSSGDQLETISKLFSLLTDAKDENASEEIGYSKEDVTDFTSRLRKKRRNNSFQRDGRNRMRGRSSRDRNSDRRGKKFFSSKKSRPPQKRSRAK